MKRTEESRGRICSAQCQQREQRMVMCQSKRLSSMHMEWVVTTMTFFLRWMGALTEDSDYDAGEADSDYDAGNEDLV